MGQTDSCQRGRVGGRWMREGEGLAGEHIRMTYGRRQQCGDGPRGGGAGWSGRRGDNYNSINDKANKKAY